MALAEHNNKVGNATIEYTDMDDATAARGSWDPAQEASNANKAGPDPDVMVYLGTFNSGAAKVSIPILCPQNLVMISPANTYPGLTKPTQYNAPNEPDVYYPNGCKRNYTRVAATDDLQGAVGAVWAQQLGATKIYVLHDSDLYGQGIAEVFNATAKKLNLNVVGGPEGIDPAASDYRAWRRRSAAQAPTWSTSAASPITTRASCGRTCARRSATTSSSWVLTASTRRPSSTPRAPRPRTRT